MTTSPTVGGGAVLLAWGYGATSTRAVADEAGVRLSLVHYHFGSKQRLLLAVLKHENAGLLDRRRGLYAAPGPLAGKWRVLDALGAMIERAESDA